VKAVSICLFSGQYSRPVAKKGKRQSTHPVVSSNFNLFTEKSRRAIYNALISLIKHRSHSFQIKIHACFIGKSNSINKMKTLSAYT